MILLKSNMVFVHNRITLRVFEPTFSVMLTVFFYSQQSFQHSKTILVNGNGQ